jgi:hypothetical protein
MVDDTMSNILEEGSYLKTLESNETLLCGFCGRLPTKAYLCPRRCGSLCCGLGCLVKHTEDKCDLKEWMIPRYQEICPYTNAIFSAAVASELVAIGPPLDEADESPEILSPEGLSFISWWCDDKATAMEHFRPPDTWLKASEITVADNRSKEHPLGLPHLRSSTLIRAMRQDNEVFLLALGRLKWRLTNWGFCCIEALASSWGWQFPQTHSLRKLNGVFYTLVTFSHKSVVGSLAFLHNCPKLHQALNRANFSDGTCSLAQLTTTYAMAVRQSLDDMNSRTLPMAPSLRPWWVRSELQQSTKRLAESGTTTLAAECLVKLLRKMEPGKEKEHLQLLLSCVNYKGSMVEVGLTVGEEGSLSYPYPAFAWRWQSVQSYGWEQTQHINVLEFVSMFNYLRSLSNKTHLQHLRLFHVLDSRVVCGVLSKGRSSSRRLNRCCRRLLPLVLGMDWYLYSLWTISDWQFSDAASRLYPLRK